MITPLQCLCGIGFEFNGPWNGYNQGLYPIAFRRFVDLLREEGAHNIVTIWCYEPNSPGDFDAVGPDGEPLWYPGDEYVDWFGLDLFYHSCFTSVASVGMSSDGDGLVEEVLQAAGWEGCTSHNTSARYAF